MMTEPTKHAAAHADRVIAQGIESSWRDRLRREDGGSYCENASPEYVRINKIVQAATALTDALIAYERGTDG